jgi:hypothetical protein
MSENKHGFDPHKLPPLRPEETTKPTVVERGGDWKVPGDVPGTKK